MKVLVAMSGGVDSAVCALLVKQAGHEPVGITMRLLGDGDLTRLTPEEADAKAVADRLSIPFQVVDLREAFERAVIGRFAREYAAGRTPNPCIDCNRHIKFGALLSYAESLGCEKIATGHYARVTRDERGVYHLQKALDPSKDQSYVLGCLTQETLSRVLLPLGDLTKEEARAIAREKGFTNAHKKDSQDICFIPEGDHLSFLLNLPGFSCPQGSFIDPDGKVLGPHKGLCRYTPGQRRGLGLSLPAPLYVSTLDPHTGNVHLSREEALYKSSLTLRQVNYVAPKEDLFSSVAPITVDPSIIAPSTVDPATAADSSIPRPTDCVTPWVYPSFPCTARVRYRQKETPATATLLPDGRLQIDFSTPVRAPAPGQTAVLYGGPHWDEVLASGEIESPF